MQMNGNKLYFPVVLFIIMYKVVQCFESVDEILKCEQYLHLVLFILLNMAVLLFESVGEILKFDYLNESC